MVHSLTSELRLYRCTRTLKNVEPLLSGSLLACLRSTTYPNAVRPYFADSVPSSCSYGGFPYLGINLTGIAIRGAGMALFGVVFGTLHVV